MEARTDAHCIVDGDGAGRCGAVRHCSTSRTQTVVDERLVEWKAKFAPLGKAMAALTGETTADLKILERNSVVICTPEHWDMLSRRWKQRKNVQNVDLFIMDEIHLLGGTLVRLRPRPALPVARGLRRPSCAVAPRMVRAGRARIRAR